MAEKLPQEFNMEDREGDWIEMQMIFHQIQS